jgi:hypothetical protein
MGYESRIYFCREYNFPEPIHHSEIIAMIDMCKMGYSDTVMKFRNCFDVETTFAIYIPGCDEDGNEIMIDETEDKYGDRIKYASDVDELYNLAMKMAEENDYWRFNILKGMIENFKEYPDIKIVHYGY